MAPSLGERQPVHAHLHQGVGAFVLRNEPQPRTVDVAAELRAARAAIDRVLAALGNKS